MQRVRDKKTRIQARKHPRLQGLGRCIFYMAHRRLLEPLLVIRGVLIVKWEANELYRANRSEKWQEKVNSTIKGG